MGDGEDTYARYYYTPSFPSAYGGSRALKRQLKAGRRKGKKIDSWLSGQDAYTLHKPIVRKFRRRKTITAGIGQQLQADLIDVKNHAEDNDGHKFILTAIDVFSKKAWATAVKNKSGTEISRAFLPILMESSPDYLQTDKGKEFLNADVKRVLDKFNVTHFTSENENIKASVVERFNKSLRNTLHRYFTKSGRERYLDVLKEILEAYNNRFHSSIGMAPNEVSLSNQEDVWLRLYDPIHYFKKIAPEFEVGDFVRLSKSRTAFQRGFTPNWTIEVFIVDKILHTSPITYKIRDWNGDKIEGSFYDKELQKIRKPKDFKIESILDRKKLGRRKMVLVKWMGYSDDFNQWIPEANIRELM